MGDRRIVVKADEKTNPDLQKLARALIALARLQLAKEADRPEDAGKGDRA